MRPALMQIAPSSEPVRIRYSRLQEPLAMADAGLIPYGMSIDFRLESLARSGFCKKADIDAHRSKHESIA